MAVGELYREITNIRAVGSEATVYDYFTIPGSVGPGSVLFRLTELPLNVPLPNPQSSAVECREVDAFNVELPGPVRLTAISQSGVLSGGKFVIKFGTNDVDDTFRFGQIRFSQYDAGRRFKIICTGRGSLVYADDVLNLNHGLSLLPGVIKPGHISTASTDDFTFPRDVNITGDLNITGVVNKSISEVLSTTDDELLMNSAAVAPGPDIKFTANRGGANPSLVWDETLTAWELVGTTSNKLLSAFDTGSPRVRVHGNLLVDGTISISGIFTPPTYTTAQEAAITVVGNVPGIFYNSDERQMKAIVSDGMGGAELTILG